MIFRKIIIKYNSSATLILYFRYLFLIRSRNFFTRFILIYNSPFPESIIIYIILFSTLLFTINNFSWEARTFNWRSSLLVFLYSRFLGRKNFRPRYNNGNNKNSPRTNNSNIEF